MVDVGDVLHYYPPGHAAGAPPLAAVVAAVHGSQQVTLQVVEADGTARPARSVKLLRRGEAPPAYGEYCRSRERCDF
jgi:hypothetical protein